MNKTYIISLMDKNLVISVKTILIFFLMLFAAYIMYRLGSVISTLLICTVLVISMERPIKFFMSKTLLNNPMPRGTAVIITYLILLSILVLIVTLGLPPVINQSQKLLMVFSSIAEDIKIGTKTETSVASLIPQLSNISENIFNVTRSFLSNLTTLFSILIISVYMSLDWVNIKKRFISLFSGKLKKEVAETLEEIETSLGSWVKGELILMTIVGTMGYVGLLLLQVQYPLALGLVSGVLEAVPIIGPVISTVIATIIAFSDSPVKGLAVLALFILIQQLENNLIVPKVMQKVSGFSPIIILLALLIGSNLFGVPGAVLAVPFTMVSVVIVKRIIRYNP